MLKPRIKKIYSYRHTLWDMAVKQLKAKYIGSILGIFWAVINPLLMMSAISFVFTAVFKIQIKNFPLFALAGIFPWMFFSSALSEATFSILGQQSILRQFNLPREIIPLSSILANFFNFLIGWIIIYPLFLFFNPKIIVMLPLLIIALLLNFFFVCGLGLLFSVLNVFWRDIGQLLGILLIFWFWVTPIFYSLDMIPLKFRWVCNFNPLTAYIVYYREVIFTGSPPSLSMFLAIFFWALVSLIIGLSVFSSLESKLLKEV
ncbi:MAG: ABC transporter permease [Candidatus Omnitrophica bacterium]|nr:ABC transporter permease [Candidatus Omnitrophota bacterium]